MENEQIMKRLDQLEREWYSLPDDENSPEINLFDFLKQRFFMEPVDFERIARERHREIAEDNLKP